MATGDTQATPAPNPNSSPLPGLVPAAFAVLFGVIADRLASPATTTAWALTAAALAAFAAWRAHRNPQTARWGLILAIGALGAGWHHARWSDRRPDDLSLAFDAHPGARPSWLRGVLVAVPEWSPTEGIDLDGRTRTVLDATHASDGNRWQPASGRVRLIIAGRRTDLRMGDPITVAGTLEAIPGPRNPGEFDLRAKLRADGIRLRLRAGDPRALERWNDGPWWPLTRALGAARLASSRRLSRFIPSHAEPLAAALLLGRREAVDPETDDAFARTGTTHLLAISGLHLQALAVALLVLARGVGLPRRPSYLLVLVATVGYALLVGLMPSVGRSAAMTVAVCLAKLLNRPTRFASLMAAAALGVLAWNPTDLFDIGAQLSFLGVAALLWGAWPLEQGWRARTAPSGLDALERALAPWWKRTRFRLWQALGAMLRASIVVWFVTAPLVAWRFHILSPIGILLNVPLIPITSVALGLAGFTLAGSPLWPWLARKAGQTCGILLGWTSHAVHKGALVPGGHTFTMGPDMLWVSGFYGILLGLAVSFWAQRSKRVWAIALAGWLAILPVWQWSRGLLDAPEAEVLAVDHGLSVIVRGKPGHALLYDCGRMRDPRVGRRVIAPALWARGVRKLDAVVLSHADFDHASGLIDLLDRLPVGALLLAPGFDRSGDAWATALLAEIERRRIPIREVSSGDQFDLGGGLNARVLHPPLGWLPDAPDNARSVVLGLDALGHRLLLPGDLEGAGLSELVSKPSPPFDVLLSPHHGSRAANPPWLFDWAKPHAVVVSQNAPAIGGEPPLAAIAQSGLPVLRTSDLGAIRIRWAPNGLGTRGFLEDIPDPRPTPYLAASSMPRLGLRGLLSLLGLALGLVGFLAMAVIVWGAWALVRPGGRRLVDPPAPEPPPWEPFSATTPDGLRLAGAWRRAEGPPTGRTAMLIHGLGEDRHALQSRGDALASQGWNVALLDTRNRGQSEGDWTTFGTREAADLSSWLVAIAPLIAPQPLAPVAWGRSMGAAIALRFQAETSLFRALILEAPYDDLRPSVARWLSRRRMPTGLATPLLRYAARLSGAPLDRPRPLDFAPIVHVPTLVIAGADDNVAPAEAARRLADALPGSSTFLEIPSARHTDVFDVGGPDLVHQIATFLNLAIPPEPFASSPTSLQSDRHQIT